MGGGGGLLSIFFRFNIKSKPTSERKFYLVGWLCGLRRTLSQEKFPELSRGEHEFVRQILGSRNKNMSLSARY